MKALASCPIKKGSTRQCICYHSTTKQQPILMKSTDVTVYIAELGCDLVRGSIVQNGTLHGE